MTVHPFQISELDYVDLPIRSAADWARLAAKLSTWVTSPSQTSESVLIEGSLPDRARKIYKLRRKREKSFGDKLFADPAWDILLDLFIAKSEGRLTRVSSVCIASAAPLTTGLRHLSHLVDRGLVVRALSQDDSRVVHVELSKEAEELMANLLNS